MKKILYIVMCSVFIGCSSMNTAYNKEKLREVTNLAYTTPVFDTETNTSNSKRIQSFKKYINFGIDSLFTIDAKKYNISKKIAVNDTNTRYIESLFSINTNILSSELKTLLKNSNEKHVLFSSFKPKLGYALGKFEIVKSSQMEAIIIEVATGDIIFRDAFSSSDNGFNKQLMRIIEEFFRKLNK